MDDVAHSPEKPSPVASVRSIAGVFDIFRIGLGPSSSHTVGPMIAAARFRSDPELQTTVRRGDRVRCDLFGSLALTGIGHGTGQAIVLGLCGIAPDAVDPDQIEDIIAGVVRLKKVAMGNESTDFDPYADIIFHKSRFLAGHPNGLTLSLVREQLPVFSRTYLSIGGGQVISADSETGLPTAECAADGAVVPYVFSTMDNLLELASSENLSIAQIMLANASQHSTEEEVLHGLDTIWEAMDACIQRGLRQGGELPGGLRVRRRAPDLYRRLLVQLNEPRPADPLAGMEWVNLFALAVNEENAAGGRVVTAPTNGAAGIIPAVVAYYLRFVSGASRGGVHDILLTAAAVGALIKRNASISGADVGCQGEVGSASAMAAAGYCAVLGGSSAQIENAAEIALEHSLGLTCDPVGGLVQIPCIERNAIAANKAINAARLALMGDGLHRVSLDVAIETMRQIGADMSVKFKETSLGGLAVNVPLC